MKTIIGIYPQQQMVTVEEGITDAQIRARFGLGEETFTRVPYVDTPKPDPLPGKMWVPSEAWGPTAVTRTWTAIDYEEPVPASITPRQMKLWLLSQPAEGGKTMYDTAVGHINAPADTVERRAQQIAWVDAKDIIRSDPLVAAIGQLLGLSSTQIDQAFREAALL